MNKITIIIAGVFILLSALLFILTIIIKNKRKNNILSSVDKLTTEKNLIISSQLMSEYSKEYMEVLLEEAYNGNINSEKIKDAFEKVYCKCSEVVSHLYVNIRHIYDIHEEHIRKFYANKSEEILKEFL